MYSGRDFGWIYERQDQVSFLDGHVRAFAHLGGVPARIAYDNLRAGRHADPRRRRRDCSPRALRRWPRTTCSSRASVGPAKATTRAASRRAAKRFARRRWCRFRAGRRSRRSTTRCSRSSMRRGAPAARRQRGRSASASPRSSATCDRSRVAFVAEAIDVATITPRALARVEGAYLLGAVSLGRASI